MSWPKDPNTFPPPILRAVERTFSQIVGALAEGEEVRVLVDNEASETHVRAILEGSPTLRKENVTFVRLKTVDVWVRDYAPIYLRREGDRGGDSRHGYGSAETQEGRALALTKWVFNSWGNKYEDLRPDDEAGRRIARSTGLEVFEPGIVLEGGSVDVNGLGTVLTTEQCLLNPNRNPALGRGAIEGVLKEYLGVTKVVWLGSGIDGDDTDGHVDDIARFVSPSVVAIANEENSSDQNRSRLEENIRRLKAARDQEGDPFEVVTVPMPSPVNISEGRLPASHLNFYIGNSAVLVPTFGSPTDSMALSIIRDCFPGRDALGMDCRALVYGLGTLHCVTQQIPAGEDRHRRIQSTRHLNEATSPLT